MKVNTFLCNFGQTLTRLTPQKMRITFFLGFLWFGFWEQLLLSRSQRARNGQQLCPKAVFRVVQIS
jgi:hypothetical protein